MSYSYTSASIEESQSSPFSPSAKYNPSVNDAKSRRQLVVDPLSDSDDVSDEALESQRLNALEEFEDSADVDPEEGLPFYQKRRGKLIIAVVAIVLIVLAAIIAVVISSTGSDSDDKSGASSISSNGGEGDFSPIYSSPAVNPTVYSTQSPTNSPFAFSPVANILPPSPKPTRPPVGSGSSFPDRQSRYNRLVAMLNSREITGMSSFSAGGSKTSQVRAVEWLLDNDSLDLLRPNKRTPAARIFQRYILATLFFELKGEMTNSNGWLSDDHECNWNGVSCADKTIPSISLFDVGDSQIGQLTTEEQFVVQLDLEENGLSGSLPGEIGFLSDCTVLSVYGNDLSGTIPTTIGQMVALNKLWLEDNEFTGSLPTEIGLLRNVDDLSFYENQIEGIIPTEIGMLTRLERLWANNMRITGPIPSEIGLLTNLENVYLDVNFLSGGIPSELGLATNLRDIRLFRNGLGGNIPTELFSLSNLEIAYLDTNRLSGKIPSEVDGLVAIKDFQLFSNKLTGPIPFQISSLGDLAVLRLNGNDLTGSMPPMLGSHGKLLRLTLSSNRLVGSIPDSLQQSTSIRRIEVDNNSLEGRLPEWIGNLKELLTLNVANNRFDGSIPSSYSALQELEEVRLERNDLVGSVPQEWCELEALTSGMLSADCGGSSPEFECSCCKLCIGATSSSRSGQGLR
mmetsp:Transcript_21885/g.32336  ORF Transcript_21885/g.32336 Transcript_21885/m.32336 type:complete len:682 (-) Transcript_21885:28-2073(-)|eukprot:CAMPEP_0194206880 /NCGR_PEP_ID=MMETSP0156-20130528/5796_1 /TAXON_ID=33649 /ORGANISM="Thalassionema nitzschioides, Strain L26-B" /LENGTH=681 /DNA_ID=CAMNT_0038933513 /DNA_START=69 /DNA_END=2114 /DNA_ORIENTATION=-